MSKDQNKHSNPFGGKVVSNPFGKTNDEISQNLSTKPKTYESSNFEEKEKNPPKKNEIINEIQTTKTKQIEKSMIKEKDEQQNLKEIMLREYEKLKNFNSNESVMRMNVRTIPSNVEVLKESGITLGLTISPLANTNTIPIIKYKDDEEIPRCNSCKAYINPFLNWIDGGDKWICNLCKSKNITATYYYETIDKTGQRKDIGSRPEISVGSYEFFATKSFLGENFGKDLPSPVYIFAFDVSLASIGSGYLSSCIDGVKQVISDGFPFDINSKIGIITYDSAVHFYNLNKKLTQPQIIQVNESKVFLPLPLKFLFGSISECKDLILSTLDSIQNNFKENIVRDASKLIEALDAISLLTYKIGGKVLLFHASHSIRDNVRNNLYSKI